MRLLKKFMSPLAVLSMLLPKRQPKQKTVGETLEEISTYIVEWHVTRGKTFIRLSDWRSKIFPYQVLREELLQDPRVFPKYGEPNILKLDPNCGAS